MSVVVGVRIASESTLKEDVCSLSKKAFSVSPSPREPFLREPPRRKPPLKRFGSKGSVLSIHGALYEEVFHFKANRSSIWVSRQWPL